jgi:hypothetical protein
MAQREVALLRLSFQQEWELGEFETSFALARSDLEIVKESAVRSNHRRLTATLFEGKTERESAVTCSVVGIHHL